MDERELAHHVLAIVDQTAYRISAHRILGVHLEIGGRRTFDLDRLCATFSDVAQGTVAEGAQLFVKVVPVTHHCRGCGHNFEASKQDCPCPECDQPHTEPVGGEELRILDLEIDDSAA